MDLIDFGTQVQFIWEQGVLERFIFIIELCVCALGA